MVRARGCSGAPFPFSGGHWCARFGEGSVDGGRRPGGQWCCGAGGARIARRAGLLQRTHEPIGIDRAMVVPSGALPALPQWVRRAHRCSAPGSGKGLSMAAGARAGSGAAGRVEQESPGGPGSYRERTSPLGLIGRWWCPRALCRRCRRHSDFGERERSIPLRIPRHEVECWPRQEAGSGQDGFPGKNNSPLALSRAAGCGTGNKGQAV